jgi:hypothetical protein
MSFDTSETKESVNRAASAVCDTLRYLGDLSYAVLPHDIAHSLGDLKKSFLSFVRTAVDQEIEWIDDRIAGGDRLRDEWRQSCARDTASGTSEPVN